MKPTKTNKDTKREILLAYKFYQKFPDKITKLVWKVKLIDCSYNCEKNGKKKIKIALGCLDF